MYTPTHNQVFNVITIDVGRANKERCKVPGVDPWGRDKPACKVVQAPMTGAEMLVAAIERHAPIFDFCCDNTCFFKGEHGDDKVRVQFTFAEDYG